jgi:LacI family transcriptional regulator
MRWSEGSAIGPQDPKGIQDMGSDIRKVPQRQRSQFIQETLRKRIRTRAYAAGQPLPSERALAEEFQVARATVRNALGKLIDEGLVEARSGLGNYVRKREKRTPAALRSTTVGVILHRIDNPFFAAVASHLEQGLSKHGFSMLLASTKQDPSAERECLERLRREGVRGLITWPAGEVMPRAEYASVLKDGVAAVVLGGNPSDLALDTVSVDDRSGMEMAVEHLLGLGHRRFGYISAFYRDRKDERWDVIRNHLLLRQVPIVDEWFVRPGAVDHEGGRKGMRQLLALDQRPTAVLAINDISALGALREATRAGVAIPDELSIMGFDDIPLAEVAEVPLTTVRQPIEEIARLAVDRLVARLRGHRGRAVDIQLKPELIVRRSTATVRAEAE